MGQKTRMRKIEGGESMTVEDSKIIWWWENAPFNREEGRF
jgi:hypothetical protein